jgi:hypothetical protein
MKAVLMQFLYLIAITVIYGYIYSTFDPIVFGFRSKIDPYYFSSTTTSSVGYGDFSPKTTSSKLVVMSHQALLLIAQISLLVEFIKLHLKFIKIE